MNYDRRCRHGTTRLHRCHRHLPRWTCFRGFRVYIFEVFCVPVCMVSGIRRGGLVGFVFVEQTFSVGRAAYLINEPAASVRKPECRKSETLNQTSNCRPLRRHLYTPAAHQTALTEPMWGFYRNPPHLKAKASSGPATAQRRGVSPARTGFESIHTFMNPESLE